MYFDFDKYALFISPIIEEDGRTFRLYSRTTVDYYYISKQNITVSMPTSEPIHFSIGYENENPILTHVLSNTIVRFTKIMATQNELDTLKYRDIMSAESYQIKNFMHRTENFIHRTENIINRVEKETKVVIGILLVCGAYTALRLFKII